jgi:hypothetical protein
MQLTVYDKLLRMAKEETQGQKKVNLKELCNKISSRFRLTNKDIFVAFKEMEKKRQFNLSHNSVKFEA